MHDEIQFKYFLDLSSTKINELVHLYLICCFLNFWFRQPLILKNSTCLIWTHIISSNLILTPWQVPVFECWKLIDWEKNMTLQVLTLQIYKWVHFTFIMVFFHTLKMRAWWDTIQVLCWFKFYKNKRVGTFIRDLLFCEF